MLHGIAVAREIGAAAPFDTWRTRQVLLGPAVTVADLRTISIGRGTCHPGEHALPDQSGVEVGWQDPVQLAA